jgi:hypothetical protein
MWEQIYQGEVLCGDLRPGIEGCFCGGTHKLARRHVELAHLFEIVHSLYILTRRALLPAAPALMPALSRKSSRRVYGVVTGTGAEIGDRSCFVSYACTP